MQKRLTDQSLLDVIASADGLYKESRFDEAINLYKQVLLSLDETFAFDRCELYRKIGNCYYAQKNNDGARRAYEKTLDYCTTNGSIYAILAYLYYYVDNDIAIDYYSKTVEITPTDEVSLSFHILHKKTPHFSRFCATFVHPVQTVVHSARLALLRGHVILRYITAKEVYPSPWHAAPATTPAPGSSSWTT